MASVTRRPASTVVPVLRAKQIHTFAFALLDLKVIIVKKVRNAGLLIFLCTCYLVFNMFST